MERKEDKDLEGLFSRIRPYTKGGIGNYLLIKRGIFDRMEAKHRELGRLRAYFLEDIHQTSEYVLQLP